jgi:hypothetical protein
VCYNISNNFKGEIENPKSDLKFSYILCDEYGSPCSRSDRQSKLCLPRPSLRGFLFLTFCFERNKKCNSLAVFHVYIDEKRDEPMKTARNGAEIKNRKHLLFSPPLLREFLINSIYHPIHSL